MCSHDPLVSRCSCMRCSCIGCQTAHRTGPRRACLADRGAHCERARGAVQHRPTAPAELHILFCFAPMEAQTRTLAHVGAACASSRDSVFVTSSMPRGTDESSAEQRDFATRMTLLRFIPVCGPLHANMCVDRGGDPLSLADLENVPSYPFICRWFWPGRHWGSDDFPSMPPQTQRNGYGLPRVVGRAGRRQPQHMEADEQLQSSVPRYSVVCGMPCDDWMEVALDGAKRHDVCAAISADTISTQSAMLVAVRSAASGG